MLKVNVKNVSYEKNGVRIFEQIDANFNCGEVSCLTGSVGSGKTTLLNIISNVIPDIVHANYIGKCLLDGKEISGESVDYVLQHAENSLFFDTVLRQLSHINQDDYNYWLELLRAKELLPKATSDLSIGQKKVISILSCLLSGRKICLLDEPTANLDRHSIKVIEKLIHVKKEHKIIIIASHDEKIISCCDNIYVIKNGTIMKENNYLFKRNIYIGHNHTKDRDSPSGALITIKNLMFSYPDGSKCFNNLCLNLLKNELLAIIGPNGCGKSTLNKIIIEAIQKKRYHPGITINEKINCSIFFQDFYKQFFSFSVMDELMFGIKRSNADLKQAYYYIDAIGLRDQVTQMPHFLSGGQKRMLLICSFLMRKTDLLIFDEPFDCLDNYFTEIIKKLLMEYKIKYNATMIINEQDEEKLTGFCERIIRLDKTGENQCET